MTQLPSLAHRARTKIIATVGPVSSSEEMLRELILAGADILRLNMAHRSCDEHEVTVRRIRRTSQALGFPIGILVDLSGPKIRLCELPGDQMDCHLDQRLRFVRGQHVPGSGELTTTYEPLIDELKQGDRVMLADASVGLVVEECGQDFAECRVTQAGQIRSRQGVNLPGVKLSVPSLSPADREAAVWAAGIEADFVGLSFVRSADDVRELKAILRGLGSRARVIAKIEKPEALAELDEIVKAADGLMVARGDLGVEIDLAEVPLWQKRIIAAGNRLQRPVIVATQMLDSMEHTRWPTRAEVTDVANAVLDGCDACMLSGETAVGNYPREAVEMMNRIALATETRLLEMPPLPAPEARADGVHQITEAMVLGAERVARQLDARLVIVASRSGATALAMSKRRIYSPIVGISSDEASLRQMSLYWGVMPLRGAPVGDLVALKAFVHDWAVRDGIVKPGDCVVLVAGTILSPGSHNLMEVHRVEPPWG